MRKWLLRILNACDMNEAKLLDAQVTGLRNELIQMKARHDELVQHFGEAVTEKKRLQEIIFERFGVTVRDYNAENMAPQMQQMKNPIRTSPRSITSIMQEMARDDRERVKSLAGENNAPY